MNVPERALRNLVRVLLLLGMLVVSTVPAFADGTPPDDAMLKAARFDQKLNAQVPTGLHFRDEAGRDVALGSYFGARPTVLIMAYYNCPNLCPLVIDNLVGNLRKIAFDAGNQYNVVAVSIDPREKPALAASKKQHYLTQYARPATAGGWHFLTGEEANIGRLAAAVGFHYAYDKRINEYSHPSGLIVLTPQGRIARYFYGFDYSPTDLRLGLVEASAGRIGTAVDQVLLRCYHYDPVTGKYDVTVMNIVRAGGVATTLVIGAFVALLFRREGKSSNRQGAKDARKEEDVSFGTAHL
jgi:protein SCO1/2